MKCLECNGQVKAVSSFILFDTDNIAVIHVKWQCSNNHYYMTYIAEFEPDYQGIKYEDKKGK